MSTTSDTEKRGFHFGDIRKMFGGGQSTLRQFSILGSLSFRNMPASSPVRPVPPVNRSAQASSSVAVANMNIFGLAFIVKSAL